MLHNFYVDPLFSNTHIHHGTEELLLPEAVVLGRAKSYMPTALVGNYGNQEDDQTPAIPQVRK
jgi:hypothetical protein